MKNYPVDKDNFTYHQKKLLPALQKLVNLENEKKIETKIN